MGSEAICRVSYKGEASEGKALLETSELLFRGDFRLKIPFGQVASVESQDGELKVGFDGGVAVFELGRNAETWAQKIRNPRGLMDKLGVKDGMQVVVLGVRDGDFEAQLTERTGKPKKRLSPETDLIFYEADVVDDLIRLRSCESRSSRREASGSSHRRARARSSRTSR